MKLIYLSILIVICFLATPMSAQTYTDPTYSLCNKYAEALFGFTNAQTEANLIQALVTRAILGDNSTVPGIITPGSGSSFSGTIPVEYAKVNLLPFFTGRIPGSSAQNSTENFFDDGGVAALAAGYPNAQSNKNSKQYGLITHLYGFFGKLLKCGTLDSQDVTNTFMFGNIDINTPMDQSMAATHAHMGLTKNDMDYFIYNVAKSATSFGVTIDDVTAIGVVLNSVFNTPCSEPNGVVDSSLPKPQNICSDSSCGNSTADNRKYCSAYPTSTYSYLLSLKDLSQVVSTTSQYGITIATVFVVVAVFFIR